MKTNIFVGQPGKPGCLNFENVEALQAWLLQKEAKLLRCTSAEKGSDGTRCCSAEPHLYKIRLPAARSITGSDIEARCCGNHFRSRMDTGWLNMGKLCTNCTTSESSTPEGYCERCMEQLTAPDSTDRPFCKNYQQQVTGCITYALQGGEYCAFCVVQRLSEVERRKDSEVGASDRPIRKLRVRPVPTSTRPCHITNGCSGNMTASVRYIVDGQPPELWWVCPVCRRSQIAGTSEAITDPRVEQAKLEEAELEGIAEMGLRAAADRPETTTKDSIDPDMTDMVAHVRGMIREPED